jgi:hypothetical protein
MSGKRLSIIVAMGFLILSAVFPQGADPKTVVPAWVTEKQFVPEPVKPVKNFSLFFIGYDFPSLSGSLASHLTSWQSSINFSLGIESMEENRSSFLSGIEAELFLTVNNKGSRVLMNDMAMIGYSFNLKPVKLNIGARLGLCLLDVIDDSSAANTYTGIGGVIGPEASLYVELAPDFWLWARARYSLSYYLSMDTNPASPIATGSNSLNCLSLEAGLAFRM